jgi:phenylpyruvate tautomerase PptA (4-oxalocrotonate tautomerase family)
MPHFTVHAVEEDLDERREAGLIRGLTEAVVAVYGERARPLVVVQLVGVPRRRWGVGGQRVDALAPVVTLGMREPALTMPGIDDPPARLIASITDAVAFVYGERVRAEVTVEIVGVPTGRSGVGGVAV